MINYVPFGVTKFLKINRLKNDIVLKKALILSIFAKFTRDRIDLKICGIAHPS